MRASFLVDLVVPVGLIFSLGFRQSFIQSLFFFDEFSDFLRVDAVDQPALLGHFPREVFVGNQPVEVCDRQLRGKEVFDFLSREVIEVPDLVGGQNFNMHRHLADPLLVLQLQPRRERHLLADFGDELLVHLGAPLQAVQGVLQFIHELVGFSSKTGGVTGGLQVGDRANLISFGLIRNQREIPPRTLLLGALWISLFRAGPGVRNGFPQSEGNDLLRPQLRGRSRSLLHSWLQFRCVA